MPEENKPNNPAHLPLFRKGKEVYELTNKIIELIPEDDEAQVCLKQFMLQDAAMLSVKVAGAEAADVYDLRMENAAIIRKAARDLLAHCSRLELFGFEDSQYLLLIREEVEAYRLLFVKWVKGFDRWNYVEDSWGLFNPPGINPSLADKDFPDEE